MTKFIFLSEYDKFGRPSKINIDESGNNIAVDISQAVLDEISENLPGGVTVVDKHPQWIRKSDISINDNCEIILTFITEGAGYRNGLGYYVYDTENPPNRFSDIKEIYIIFPNASKYGAGGSLYAGDSMKLVAYATSTEMINGVEYMISGNYNFPSDQSIGFVCFSNQWKHNGTSNARLVTNHHMFSSDPVLNPEKTAELAHHCINYLSEVDNSLLVFGFEDLRRDKRSDDDFNDLIFCLNVNPSTAVSKSSVNTTKYQKYNGFVICEDILGKNGDFDYNDLVTKYEIQENFNGDSITSIYIKLRGDHYGANYDHVFGVVIPKIKSQPDCKIFRESYFTNSGKNEKICLTGQIIGGSTDKIPIMDKTSSFFVNDSLSPEENYPSYVVLKIIFPRGVSPVELGINNPDNYKFYLDVFTKHKDTVNHTFYSDDLYEPSDEMKALGINKKKKIRILSGCKSFRHTVEKIPLRKAYPKLIKNEMDPTLFKSWFSEGVSKIQFLKNPISHTDVHKWDDVVNENNLMFKNCGDDLLFFHPIKFYSGTFKFNESVSQMALSSNSLYTSNILDWDYILTLQECDGLYDMIKLYGSCYVKKNGEYYKNISLKRVYYVLTIGSELTPSLDVIQTSKGYIMISTTSTASNYIGCLL